MVLFKDPRRLYYEPFELRVFENIECEWPLFFCFSMLDFLFQGDKEAVEEYAEALEEVCVDYSVLFTSLGFRVSMICHFVDCDQN